MDRSQRSSQLAVLSGSREGRKRIVASFLDAGLLAKNLSAASLLQDMIDAILDAEYPREMKRPKA